MMHNRRRITRRQKLESERITSETVDLLEETVTRQGGLGFYTAESSKGWGQLVPTEYQNRFFPSGDGPPLFTRIQNQRCRFLQCEQMLLDKDGARLEF